jgi:hypothetical protein
MNIKYEVILNMKFVVFINLIDCFNRYEIWRFNIFI